MQVRNPQSPAGGLLSCGFGLAMALVASTASAEHYSAEHYYAVGDTIEALILEDQHGERHPVDASVNVVLFSRDMKGGEVLKEGLADVAPGYLAAMKAVYVADISEMPGMVARMFAIPAMRDRPYSILLDRDGDTTARLPDVDGQATLIFLDRLTVQRIVSVSEPAALKRQLSEEKGDGGIRR